MMVQPTRVVGDYIVDRQIGSGSFSDVWLARHRVHGTEVAIKEIAMDRLTNKLHDSLLSEIAILKKINHPNIIRLHDIVEAPGRIHLILEYCRGGDLSIFIRRCGRVSEATAKHFMQQLAAGLQILRENNLIHRDLKPQNLLLFSNDNHAVLKIADFGFARSLHPRGLAETLCGSPLYMAPEIMQLQKYGAKADLWSVGTILFQLVTGKTPFTGNNQIQLLQNILKSNELCFTPDNKNLSSECTDLCKKLLRQNPVERLTFEEFFNHPFLSPNQPEEPLSTASRTRGVFPLAECIPGRCIEESSQDDYLPFLLDDDFSGSNSSPSFASKKASMRSNYRVPLDIKVDKKAAVSTIMNIASRYSSVTHKVLTRPIKEPEKAMDPRPMKASSRDHEYVLVPGLPMEESSSSVSASRPLHLPCKPESSPIALIAPMPIIGAAISNTSGVGSLESDGSVPSGTSQRFVDMEDALGQPSIHWPTRIWSLQRCASAIRKLVNEKIDAGSQLEAFSIQLVILAIWKQALNICHAQAISTIEGSPAQETIQAWGSANKKHSSSNVQEYRNIINTQVPEAVCSEIEKEFLLEVGHAEELARDLELINGSTEMPNAMEIIFQYALALGRHGAVDELMGNLESSTSLYSKSVLLLVFLQVEAPSLILNPPFSLTNSEQFRLLTYINILRNRQGQSRSQGMRTSSNAP